MTSEEIIQRLLSEQKITVEEAMVLLKGITNKNTNIGWPYVEPWPNYPTYPNYPIVYYGPQTVPTFYTTTTTTTNDKA